MSLFFFESGRSADVRQASEMGTALSQVPFDELIRSLGEGIADAQFDLDHKGLQIAKFMSGMNELDKVDFGGRKYSLLELGFTPTFYQFVESTLEVKIILKLTTSHKDKDKSSENKRSGWFRVSTSTVTSEHTTKYGFEATASSFVRTRLVPVPAPAILEERIRDALRASAVKVSEALDEFLKGDPTVKELIMEIGRLGLGMKSEEIDEDDRGALIKAMKDAAKKMDEK